MSSYLKKAKELLEGFEVIELQQLLRSENRHRDALANMASNVSTGEKMIVHVTILEERSTVSSEVSNIRIKDATWIHEIVTYIVDGKCTRDKSEARKLQSRYCIFEGQLYRRSFSRSFAKMHRRWINVKGNNRKS